MRASQSTVVWMIATLALAGASRSAVAQILIVPDRIEVDQWPMGETVEITTWAINTGNAPAQLAGLDADDDALAGIVFEPRPLAPGEAQPIVLTITAPGEEATRETIVQLRETSTTAHELRVSVRGVHPDVYIERPDRQRGRQLRGAPPLLMLDPSAPGEVAKSDIWLINAGAETLSIISAKGNCGCLKFPGFEPTVIAPRRTLRVPVTMMALGEPGKTAKKYATFILESGEPPLTIEVHQPIIAIDVRKVERFIAAWNAGKAIEASAYLAKGATFTQNARTPAYQALSEPASLDLATLQDWVAWDETLDVERRFEGLTGAGTPDVVTGKMHEQSAPRRFRKLEPAVYEVTFTLDDSGDIAAIELIAVELGGAPLPARTADAAKRTRAAIDAARTGR